MNGIYTEENGKYQIDLTKALYSIGDLNAKYRAIGHIQSDVDWIAETADSIILIEFKHYAREQDIPKENEIGSKQQNIAKKYYGGAFYILACDKGKPIDFVWIIESPYLDSFARKRYLSSIKRWLPFELQKNQEIKRDIIRKFQILSISDWNTEYPQFPIAKILSPSSFT